MVFSKLANRIILARNFTNAARTPASIGLVVLHTMESPEAIDTAENVAAWFAGLSAPQASAHYCVDNNSIVACVDEADVAWAAPGANHNGIQIELAGRAAQTPAQWADAYSKAELVEAAKLVADICRRCHIPVKHLTNAELAAGKRGIIGHVQASQVFKKSDHTDPGTGLPWAVFIADVKALLPDKRRWQYRLVDHDGKVIDRSSITGRAGLAHRFAAFSARVAPKVAKLAAAGRGPRIRVVRVK